MVAKAGKKDKIFQENILPSLSDSENESDAPEIESNVSTRRNIKSIDKLRKAKKRSIANKPAPLMNDRDIDESEIQMESDNLSNEASTSSVIATTSTSHLLDPSLFAASFAQKQKSNTLTSNGKTKVLSSHTSTSKLPTKKRFGLVKGRDGQPMKKLKDGRTIVRVLPKPTQKMDLQVENQAREETLLRPSVLDPSEVLPNAKIRAFRKHKLGLKERKSEASSKPNKSNFEEDPLGLEDPAFMKGGELEGVGLSLSKKQTAKSRPVIQRKGGRTKFTPSMSKHGSALQFARSK